MISNFIIDLHIYPFTIMFSIGETDEELQLILNGIEELSGLTNLIKDHLDLGDDYGLCYQAPKGSCIIRLQKTNRTPKWKATLSHEILHAVHRIFHKIGLELVEGSQEAYCYLLGYIIEEFYTKINETAL